MFAKKERVPTQEVCSEAERLKQLTELDYERQAVEAEAGKEETVYGLPGKLWKLLTRFESKHQRHLFKKKTYLWLMLLTGWMGVHRWYQGRRILALFETLFFWTGMPLILLVTDLMEVIPVKSDENGYISM